MKSKLESLFIILIMLLSIANIKICTDAIMRLNDNTEKMYITQGEIKSKQYLVTDEYISRISPKTEVESFVMQLGLENKEVAIYEDENKEAEIKEGLISTGMIMTVRNARQEVEEEIENIGEENINDSMQEENSEVQNTEEPQETDYKLSVVGDINQDGRANIVEVVQMINHIVGLEGKEIEGIRLVSSDINGDKEVNIIDIDKLIRYIVFEELEIGEVGAPKEPTIEVEAQEKNGWYKEDTKVSIVTEEEVFEKTVYSIDGEKFETTNREEETTIKQEGTHEIEAYTYGTIGNKSLIAEKEIKIDKQAPIVEEITKIPEEEITGIVKIEVVAKDNLSGIAEEGYSFDGGATWQKENYKEYTDNVEEIKIQVKDIAGNIAEEKISIDNIVPEKLKYKVVFKNYDGTVLQTEEVEEGNVPEYKAPKPVKAEDNTYTYEFIGWDKEISNVTANVEYVAEFKAIYKNYTVVFKNEDGTEIIRKEDYHYGDTVVIPETPQKEKTGYNCTFVGWGKEVTEVNGNIEYIAEFEELAIEYQITYELNGGTVEENPSTYNVETESFKLNNPTKKYYQFIGWTLNEETELKEEVVIEKGSIGDRKYIANWKLNAETVKIKETGIIYTSIEMAQEEVENGQTIIILQDLEENVIVPEGMNIILDLNGKKISNAREETSTIVNKGILTIIDSSEEKTGGVENTTNQSIVNEANALLNMGNKEDEVFTSPYINGKEIGIKNEGILNFYDGKVEGTKAIQGNINEVAPKYNMVMSKKEIEEEIEVREVITLGLMADSVARIDNLYYTSIEQAIESLVIKGEEIPEQEQSTITILKDVVVTNQIIVEEYMNIRIDLNNYVVSSTTNSESMINNAGKLEITDLSEEKTGKLTSTSVNTLINNGEDAELKITGGTITSEKVGTSSVYTKIINNNGNLEITGGTIVSSANYLYLVLNNAEAEIYGGSLSVTTSYSRCIYNNKTIVISGGTIKNSSSYGIINVGNMEIKNGLINGYMGISNTGKIVMQDGEISAEYEAIGNSSTGEVIINGGTFKTSKNNSYYDETTRKAILRNDGTGSITINGGTFNAVCHVLFSLGSSRSNIAGGTFNSNSTAIKIRGGAINISGGTIVAKNYVLHVSASGTINIVGGTLESLGNTSIILSYEDYSFTSSPHPSTGKVVLGVKDGIAYPSNIEGTYPVLKGGIKNNDGQFEFYDGIIYANDSSENAIYGSISGIEEEYDVKFTDIEADEENGIEESHFTTLEKSSVCKIVETGKNYTSIESALKEIEIGNTIQMIKDTNYIGNMLEITEEMNVKLDLNGCKITVGNIETFITNNGTLEILDSSEEKKGTIFTNRCKQIIKNNGTLTITNGIIKNNKIYSEISYSILNYGALNIDGGEIETRNTYNACNTIHNYGDINITGGTIKGYKAIYNYEDSTLKMSGGNIAANYECIKHNSIGEFIISGGNLTTDTYNSSYNYAITNASSAELLIEGGKFSGRAYLINNTGNGTITINKVKDKELDLQSQYTLITNEKGTVNITNAILTSSSSVSLITNKDGNVCIDGGKIEATGNGNRGIYNTGKGTVNVIKGEIISQNGYGIENSGVGTIVLGENDKKVYPTSYPTDNNEEKYPIVKGVTYGIYNTKGNIEFYDGVVFVNTEAKDAIYGTVSSTESVYDEEGNIVGSYDILFKDIEANEETGTEEIHYAMLGNEPVCVLLNAEGGEIAKYTDLNKAIENAQEDYTIKILRSINYKEKIIIDESKSVKLDLNGEKITAVYVADENTEDGGTFIENKGALEILDSSEAKTGEITSTTRKVLLDNKGIINDIRDIKITMQTEGTSSKYNYAIKNTGTIENLGYIELTTKAKYIYLLYNEGIATSSNAEINSSNISYYSKPVYNGKDAKLTIKGGKILGSSSYYYEERYRIAGITNYGELIIDDGEISAYYGIKNEETANATINGGKVRYIIHNSSETMDITGGIIYQYLYNNSTGSINITGGTIYASVYNYNKDSKMKIVGSENSKIEFYPYKYDSALYSGVSNYGELEILGNVAINSEGTWNNYVYNSGKLKIGQNVKINSNDQFAIKNSGIFEYEGGEALTKVGLAEGSITSIPEGKEIVKEKVLIDDVEFYKYYLQDKTESVAIGDVIYNSLEEAINAEGDTKEIKLLKDLVTIINNEIPEGQNITIDLAGHNIEGYGSGYLIKNNGIFNLKNSTEIESEVKTTNGIIENLGGATIENVSISVICSSSSTYSKSNVIYNEEESNLIVDKIKVNMNKGGHQGYLLYNNKGNVEFKSANLNLNETKVIYNTGDIVIDGLTLVSANNFITNKEKGNVIINNIEGTKTGTIVNEGESTITINNGIFTKTSIENKSTGQLLIKEGNFTSTGTLISNSTGTVNIEGGTFESTKNTIYNNSTGTINIGNGTFESTSSSNYSIYNSSTGVINIKGGTILHTTNSAVYNGSTGTINIGENDSGEPKIIPEIKSNSKYGVYNNNSSGIINFYDGAIIGKIGAVYGTIEGLPEGYGIKKEIKTIELIEGLELYTLEKAGTDTSEASLNGIYYNNLQDAINACTNSEDVISLQRDISITEILTIREGQTITIDLNGFVIEGSIENNGTLNITNTKGTIEEGNYGTITGSGITNIQ